jgi:hypothetical protein
MLELQPQPDPEDEENWWPTIEIILDALGDILIDEDIDFIMDNAPKVHEAMAYINDVLPEYLPLPGYPDPETLLAKRGLVLFLKP